MASINDVYKLLGDVNAITLKRIEDKIDALSKEIHAIKTKLIAEGVLKG